MPFIHVRAYSGKDMETKMKVAQAIVKAASEAAGTPETAYTLVYEDVERERWDEDVQKSIVEPLRSKVLIDRGKPV